MTIARRYVLPLLFWALIPALSAPVLAQALTAEILFPTSDRHAVLEFSPLADDTLAVRFAFRSATSPFQGGLTQSDVKLTVGGRQATVVALTISLGSYRLLATVPLPAETGVYDISLTATLGAQQASASAAQAVLVTKNALIEKGLAWLKAQQTVTASQSARIYKQMIGSAEPSGGSVYTAVDELGSWSYYGNANAGITALALQAFLAQGYTITDQLFGATIERAVRYLLATQTTTGYHAGSIYNSSAGYETAMAIVALKSALKSGIAEPLQSEITSALDLALNYYTEDIQPEWNRVGWRYNRNYIGENTGDMSANQWAYLALNAMEYREKDVWQKIYNYINHYKTVVGDQVYIGYFGGKTWERGNTLAAIWGLTLANHYGVRGTLALADSMFNYIGDQFTLMQVIAPSSLNTAVYEGGGYYYYAYELAKALALGGKTQFLGENWYTVFHRKMEIQHRLDDQRNFYWTTGWTDPDNFAIPSSTLGDHGCTAMAILSLQTGTVPEDSRFVIRLIPRTLSGPPYAPPANPLNGLYLRIYDGEGHQAGPDDQGSWTTAIPRSLWSDGNLFTIDLLSASHFSIELHNGSNQDLGYDLYLEAYQGDNPNPVSSKHFSGIVAAGKMEGTNASLNAIGGLTVYAPRPYAFAQMQLNLQQLEFDQPVNDSTYTFTFTITEIGDSSAMIGIDIFATDLVDEQDNRIPASAFSFVPASIPTIPAGGSRQIDGFLTFPPRSAINFDQAGVFKGAVTIQSANQSRSIGVRAGNLSGSSGEGLSNQAVFFYPNPIDFSLGLGWIRYRLGKPGRVTIDIYDAAGVRVTTLLKGVAKPAGQDLSEPWNGLNDQKDRVANGVYFYVIETDEDERAVGKIAVLQ